MSIDTSTEKQIHISLYRKKIFFDEKIFEGAIMVELSRDDPFFIIKEFGNNCVSFSISFVSYRLGRELHSQFFLN